MKTGTILFIAHSAELYGAEKVLLNTVQHFSRSYDVHVAVPAEGAFSHELSGVPGVTMHTLILPKFTRHLADQLGNLLGMGSFVRQVHLLLRRTNPDLVFCNTIRNVITAVVVKLMGYPVIIHIHEKNLDGAAGKLFACLMDRFASRVIFICNYARDTFVRRAKGLQAKSTVIYNGYDGSAAIENESLPAGGGLGDFPVMVTIAKLAEHKRVGDLISAMSILIHDFPRARLHIIGEGPLFHDLAGQVRTAGLEERVSFVGYVKDVSVYLRTADVFLAPFANEGCNMATIEAMVYGRPVIAAASGGLLEIVDQGQTGFFYPVGNVDLLTELVSNVCRSDELRRELGSAGRSRAAALFSQERQMGMIEALLAETIQGKAR